MNAIESKSDGVYRELQQHMNTFPIGFPPTESGIEIKILKQLFSPLEVKIALQLSILAIPIKKIYSRIRKLGIDNVPLEELESKLDDMELRGLVSRKIKGDKKSYSNNMLAIGIFEFRVNQLTEEFIRDMHQYMEEGFSDEFFLNALPQLRTTPHWKAIIPEMLVAPYDDMRTYIKETKDQISVANCVCKQGEEIIGNPCKVTHGELEWCLIIGKESGPFLDKGNARKISKEECLNIMDKAEERGLVLQPSNFLNPRFICLCCGCCCGVLSNAKLYENPAELIPSNYYAEIDPNLCVSCGTCETRCQIDALEQLEDTFSVLRDRCLGCGLCVSTCPNGAIKLKHKEKDVELSRTMIGLYTKMLFKKYGRTKTILNMLVSRFG